jgi:hypothetical protein
MLLQAAFHAADDAVAAACPEAPSASVGQYATSFLSWIKWGVLIVLGMSSVASVGMLVFGRVTQHPKGARLGADGLMVCIVGAVLFVTIQGVINGITGCS